MCLSNVLCYLYNSSVVVLFIFFSTLYASAQITVDENNQVGIQNTTPQYPLDVGGDTRLQGSILNAVGDGGNAGDVLTSDGSNNFYWTPLGTGAWLLEGNTLSNSAFLGTKNSYPLQLITNDQLRLHIDIYGRIRQYFGGTNHSIAIGQGAGKNSMTGEHNIMMGYRAGNNITTGQSNNFIGRNAGWKNATGSHNTYFGRGAGTYNVSGSDNIFIGYLSGHRNFGSSNIFLGYRTGMSPGTTLATNTGSYNVLVGQQAGYYLAGGNRNVFLGYKAGFSETGSDRLYIESSDTNNPLIYGEFDTDLARINGSLEVTDRTGAATTVAGFDSNGKLVETALSTGGTIILGDGTTITVAGDGSTSNPYIVSSIVPPADGTETIVEGDNNTISVTGDGSTNNPYIISTVGGMAWELQGNTITPGDFIGTNNSEDLVIKTNSL